MPVLCHTHRRQGEDGGRKLRGPGASHCHCHGCMERFHLLWSAGYEAANTPAPAPPAAAGDVFLPVYEGDASIR